MPFMDTPPGSTVSSFTSSLYEGLIRKLRAITNHTVNLEPRWRHTGVELNTGYNPRFKSDLIGHNGHEGHK